MIEPITIEEILQEIEAAEQNASNVQEEIEDADSKTTTEWAEYWGVGVSRARSVIRRAVLIGVMERSKDKIVLGIDGRSMRVATYRLKEERQNGNESGKSGHTELCCS